MPFHILLDIDLFLYVALIVLFVWRLFCPWKCCGQRLVYLNYVYLLYGLLTILLVMVFIQFFIAVARDFRQDLTPMGLRVILLLTPPATLANLALSVSQSRGHMHEIKAQCATMKHDRAVNILALPPVYGLMSMSALVQVYQWATKSPDWDPRSTFGRYETCTQVGDLYEAWALYQFGKLTLELLDETFSQRTQAQTAEEAAKGDFVLSFMAVSSLAWLGTWTLMIVCLVQSGYTLWLWTFQDPEQSWDHYEGLIHQFRYAGMVAACAAVYNVHVVEHTFCTLITGYSPLLKFISVKFLVFFGFWQMWVLEVLKWIHLLHLNDAQLKLLNAALLIFECLLSSLLNCFAWPPREMWYGEHSESEALKNSEGDPKYGAAA